MPLEGLIVKATADLERDVRAPWEYLQANTPERWARFLDLTAGIDWNALNPFQKWKLLDRAGYPWGAVAKDNYYQERAFRVARGESFSPSHPMSQLPTHGSGSILTAFRAQLPHKPKTGIEAALAAVVPALIETVAVGGVAGGIASALSPIASGATGGISDTVSNALASVNEATGGLSGALQQFTGIGEGFDVQGFIQGQVEQGIAGLAGGSGSSGYAQGPYGPIAHPPIEPPPAPSNPNLVLAAAVLGVLLLFAVIE